MAVLELYLVRHAIAADRGSDYPDDSKRPLTNAGISRFRKEAKALATLEVGIELVISSPLTRAKQTAEILAQAVTSRPSVTVSDSLAPAGTPAAVFQELAKHMRKGQVALVGHEPNIGELAARLIGARTPIEFKKGAICRIDFDIFPPKGLGVLRWFATPRMLRKIG
ncbi:MAG: phosphohistidine phosphatase SixA [Acidobacteria bacterium]|nr:phosphohistidine phosphatase SixA [Acidobacteriota bacterium]